MKKTSDIQGTLVCGHTAVPFGQYSIVWGPGEEDCGIAEKKPKVECGVGNRYPGVLLGVSCYYPGPSITFSVRDGRGDRRHLELMNMPVEIVRELPPQPYQSPIGKISWRGHNGVHGQNIIKIVDVRPPGICVLVQPDPEKPIKEYTLFNCQTIIERHS